jgi:hypothetical protein
MYTKLDSSQFLTLSTALEISDEAKLRLFDIYVSWEDDNKEENKIRIKLNFSQFLRLTTNLRISDAGKLLLFNFYENWDGDVKNLKTNWTEYRTVAEMCSACKLEEKSEREMLEFLEEGVTILVSKSSCRCRSQNI